MSSGFVSGGTADAPTTRDAAWLAAQADIEAGRRRKAEDAARRVDGRSLFETLQANKAAKEDAFMEANRLKNQFRALDDDEVDYLDSVLESTRAAEEKVRQETAEGLAEFRRLQALQERSERTVGDEIVLPESEDREAWGMGKKRRRGRDEVAEGKGLKGVKVRRTSTVESIVSQEHVMPTEMKNSDTAEVMEVAGKSARVDEVAATTRPTSGLVAYGSDSDDD